MKLEIILEKGNFEESKKILKKKGMRLASYQEAIVKIDQNPELKEQLKGKWFYLEGKGPQLSGYYKFNDKRELTQGKRDIEKTVYVWKGSAPLSLTVRSDYDARWAKRRYDLVSSISAGAVALVVVGVQAGKHKHRFVCECGKSARDELSRRRRVII